MRFLGVVLLLLVGVGLVGSGRGDPGILLRLDRESFELDASDLRDGVAGPRLRVVLGSPAHPTPRGEYALERVVRNPAWWPGPTARAAGARPLPPSSDTPMGVAKIPFGSAGVFALHGGAIPLLLGKPVSGGCIRAADEDLAALLTWLEGRDSLRGPRGEPEGEIHQRFRRPARLVTR
jgi:hypothetical protein